MKYLRPKKWQDFQHYSDRRPTWIKFYTKLLDDRDYGELKPLAMLVLHHFWLFFARLSAGAGGPEPRVPHDPKWLAEKLPGRLTLASIRNSLVELIASGFIEEFDALASSAENASGRASNRASTSASNSASRSASTNASNVLAKNDENASAEGLQSSVLLSSPPIFKKEKEEEEEDSDSDARARNASNVLANGQVNASKPASTDPELDPTNREAFERVKAAYPVGIYRSSDWLTAERLITAYVSDGYTWVDILAGVQRYAAQKAATNSIGTQYVITPTRFFERNANHPPAFTEQYPLPRTKAEAQQDANIEAGLAFLRESGGPA